MTPPDAAALHAYFEKLWTDHLDMIRSILAPLVGDDHWEDAAQRLAIRLLRRLPILLAQEQDALSRGEPSPHHWPNYIARAAKNVATNMHRDASRRLQADSLDRLSSHSLPPVPCRDPEDPDPQPLTGADRLANPIALDPAIRADLASIIRSTFKELPLPLRHAALAVLENATDADEAEHRGISVSAARRRRLKAQSLLAEALTTAGYAPLEKTK